MSHFLYSYPRYGGQVMAQSSFFQGLSWWITRIATGCIGNGGMVGQVIAQKAAGVILQMIKEGKIAGWAILMTVLSK